VQGRNIVIGSGNDLFGAEDFEAPVLNAFEGLGAGDLVDEMFVNVKYGRSSVNSFDDVPVPDLLK
jgi:hypothetical protein